MFSIEVPISGGRDDYVYVDVVDFPALSLRLRLGEIVPAISSLATWRAEMYADRLVTICVRELERAGIGRLKQLGYQ